MISADGFNIVIAHIKIQARCNWQIFLWQYKREDCFGLAKAFATTTSTHVQADLGICKQLSDFWRKIREI